MPVAARQVKSEANMKPILPILTVIAFVTSVMTEFHQPTAVELKAATEDPSRVATILKGASLDQAVKVTIEILNNIEKSKATADQKTLRVATTTATLLKSYSGDAVVIAERLAVDVSPNILLIVVATAVSVTGSQAPQVMKAFLDRTPESSAQAIRNAAAHPETVLPEGLIVSIGAPVSHAVVAAASKSTALSIAPPSVPAAGGDPGPEVPVSTSSAVEQPVQKAPAAEPPAPPVVPPPYLGQ